MWLFGYVLFLVAAFGGAAALPRLRWALLIVATLGLLAPVAVIVLLFVSLQSHPIHFG